MTRVILIRHGESVANVEGRFTRDPDEPLTEAGREQARERARHIRRSHRPTALYSSPFRRALETADEMGRILNLEPRIVEELREQDFGRFKGRPYADFYGLYPAGSAERWHLRPDGGENLREVAERAGPALERLVRDHAAEELVVVSHGGVMAALRGWLAKDFGLPPVATANSGGFLLRFDGEAWEGPIDL